jgi:deoxycytidine triphosphate deaminase
MARILSDRIIESLLFEGIIQGGDKSLINPNGLELRLGAEVKFHSTGEEKLLEEGTFLRVCPGETVTITSVEAVDFSAETVGRVFPGKGLMALITPTTTMMREGISQVTTKIDAGFVGRLNWGLRNGSSKDVTLQFGEPIFKLTVFELGEDEKPDKHYGERAKDSYQGANGIVGSTRQLPADIPKTKIVSSSFNKLDPKKQLREAGYPFDYIGTELTKLDGRFEMVSKDVLLLKTEFEKKTEALTKTIEKETATLEKKIGLTETNILLRVGGMFDKKFLKIGGCVVGASCLLFGGFSYLWQHTSINFVNVSAIVVGILIMSISFLIASRS